MTDNDKSLEVLNSQQVVEKDEWDRTAQAIRDKMAEIEREFGEAPLKYIYTRPGAGGKKWRHVRPDFCEIALHKHLPGWSFIIDSVHTVSTSEGYPKPVKEAVGRLIFIIEGVRRVVGDVGEKEVEFTYRKAPKKTETEEDVYWLVAVPNQAKAAVSDCFKRCCIRALGIARNVYREKDNEHYAEFALKPSDIDALRSHEEMLEKIQGKAEGDDLTKAKGFLEEIRRILSDSDEAVRYEVLDLLKESKKFQDIFIKNWREKNENEKR